MFQDADYLYMLLELFQGGELFPWLLAERTLGGGACRFYTGCIVLALEAMHSSNNVYRDLKPENVLISKDGFLKIEDLGFAKKIQDGRTHTRCGSPEYVSPEMRSNNGHDLRTDLRSLGVFIYECLQGTTPFAAKKYVPCEPSVIPAANPCVTLSYVATYKKILSYKHHRKLRWYLSITPVAKHLLLKLMSDEPEAGSASDKIKTHK